MRLTQTNQHAPESLFASYNGHALHFFAVFRTDCAIFDVHRVGVHFQCGLIKDDTNLRFIAIHCDVGEIILKTAG